MQIHLFDWVVMLGTLASIVAYGIYKTRKVSSTESYLLGDRDLKWWTIGLSIMATQASAITFLSTPGQAFEEGMGFAQFYFGLPIAMVLLSVFVLPLYYKLKVYTAYEFLEQRFDLKTRMLTALLFLIQRGLACGITIFAPAIILSTILGWNLVYTNLFIGILVIIYTVAGGTKAVSQTQKQQMVIILTGMFIALLMLFNTMPDGVGLSKALHLAGKMEKLEIVNYEFSWDNKYNIWSGVFASVFLFMSYFGTDQSQVQRYLSGKSLTESRLGLMFNGIIKVPMQFLILFVGVMVFLFYQFNTSKLHFNADNVNTVLSSEYAEEYGALEERFQENSNLKQAEIYKLVDALDEDDKELIASTSAKINDYQEVERQLRKESKTIISSADTKAQTKDSDYVFITWVIENMPIGLIGLLLAVIFSAAMSSTASELNALATTTMVDFYRRALFKNKSDAHYLKMSKWLTVAWGCVALCVAMVANLFENLIELVNIIGSVFYGTILGVFLVAFFFKKIKGTAVFIAALIAELMVVVIFMLDYFEIINLAYLWLNMIGCILVIFFAWIITQFTIFKPSDDSNDILIMDAK